MEALAILAAEGIVTVRMGDVCRAFLNSVISATPRERVRLIQAASSEIILFLQQIARNVLWNIQIPIPYECRKTLKLHKSTIKALTEKRRSERMIRLLLTNSVRWIQKLFQCVLAIWDKIQF